MCNLISVAYVNTKMLIQQDFCHFTWVRNKAVSNWCLFGIRKRIRNLVKLQEQHGMGWDCREKAREQLWQENDAQVCIYRIVGFCTQVFSLILSKQSTVI